jgi:hypothetical protein
MEEKLFSMEEKLFSMMRPGGRMRNRARLLRKVIV